MAAVTCGWKLAGLNPRVEGRGGDCGWGRLLFRPSAESSGRSLSKALNPAAPELPADLRPAPGVRAAAEQRAED